MLAQDESLQPRLLDELAAVTAILAEARAGLTRYEAGEL